MSQLHSARLLVVDDEIGTIRLLSSIVQGFGEVFFATNGRDALAMARDKRPDLVLLDAEMPEMDGFAVCAALKQDPEFVDLPILFVTAHSDVAMETRALGLGAVDFISKPLSPAIVQARVKTHLLLKQRTDALHRLATVDGLTGLANRRTFDTTLNAEWRRACRTQVPLSLLMIDVDYFKRYNDHYGHQAGDECLRAVAQALAATTLRSGELAARYGGEEFAVILPGCDARAAIGFADKVQAKLAALAIPHAASDVARVLTLSIGITTFPQNAVADNTLWTDKTGIDLEESVGALMAAADKALYLAKRAGRNRACAAPLVPPEPPAS
jgi:diguanylate cyclase (GGDEF)-like protein